MSPEEEIIRSNEAERLMNEPMVKEALEKIEAGLLDSMKRCPLGDIETQHRLVLTLQLLGNFKGHFQEAMTTGKLARQQITNLQSDPLTQKAGRKLRSIF